LLASREWKGFIGRNVALPGLVEPGRISETLKSTGRTEPDFLAPKLALMPFIQLNDSPVREIFPGFRGHFVHSANMTFVHWTVLAGSALPPHSHPHEQVVHMIEGEFELTIDRETRRLGPGSVAIIPSNATHSGRAITECRIIDAFYPIREDYR
jgi:quercetin dioxygenase-like cupin family protein